MQDALALNIEPIEEQTVYRLRLAGDPMPMPRPRVRVIPGKGRKPAFAQIYTPAEAVKGEDCIARIWADRGYPCFPSGTSLEIRMTFGFARPGFHLDARGGVKPRYLETRPGKGRNEKGKPRTGGDIDNLAKLVLDALNPRTLKDGAECAGAYEDDSQVSDLLLVKRYVDQLDWADPGLEIVMWAA